MCRSDSAFPYSDLQLVLIIAEIVSPVSVTITGKPAWGGNHAAQGWQIEPLGRRSLPHAFEEIAILGAHGGVGVWQGNRAVKINAHGFGRGVRLPLPRQHEGILSMRGVVDVGVHLSNGDF